MPGIGALVASSCHTFQGGLITGVTIVLTIVLTIVRISAIVLTIVRISAISLALVHWWQAVAILSKAGSSPWSPSCSPCDP